MRDYWMDLATGDVFSPLIPRDEALPQLELLAELAASASGEPADWIAALVAYQVRVETLDGHILATQELAKLAVDNDAVDDLDRWTRLSVEYDERLSHYRAKIRFLVAEVFNVENAKGAAILINALTHQADRGDERAVPLIQSMMDSVTLERAQAITAEVRNIEGATVQ